MPDPLQILGLPATASEQDIRSRYLELVRQFPPDSQPARFAEIRAAYDDLSDPRQRLERQLFTLSTDSLSEIIAEVNSDCPARIPTDELLAMG